MRQIRFVRTSKSIAALTVAACAAATASLTVSAVAADRMVLGEYFTATW